jgi:aspartokinase-like uncharacterized kinase
MHSLIPTDAVQAAPRQRYVIQIGGDLADWLGVVDWMKLAARIGRTHVTVIVPTGGPFAETVREAEDMWRLAPEVVRGMMLHAMDGHGLMLHGICPELGLASDPGGMAANAVAGRASVWLPGVLAGSRPDLMEDWDATADSLALWLAIELRADRLILVKHGACPCDGSDAEAMLRDGLVGAAFAGWRSRFRGTVRCVNREHAGAFAVAFDAGLEFGCRLAPGQPAGSIMR